MSVATFSLTGSSERPLADPLRRRQGWVRGAWPTLGALALAMALGAGLSWCVFKSPLTLYDGLDPIITAHDSSSATAVFRTALGATGYLRPLRIAQVKWFFDLRPWDPVGTFTAIHATLLCVTLLLFALFLRPVLPHEFPAAAIALTVLVGHQSFFILAGEQYPINHFLEIVALAVAAAAAARGRPSRWKEFVVPALLVVGALTLESGVLVGVVVVACWVVGWRGVSARAVVLCVLLVIGYAWLRVGVLGVAGPGLEERASGYFMDRLEPSELVARFGRNPVRFYAYNIVSAFLDVILSEPRDGRWIMLRRWIEGSFRPWMAIQLVSSLVLSAAMAWAAVSAFGNWWRRRLTERDRFVLVALAVVGANSVLSYAYIKDEVLSVGAAFYAAAAYAVVASLLADVPRARWAALASAAAVVTVSLLWTSRAAGTFFNLRTFAYKTATDWGSYEPEQAMPRDWAVPDTRRLFLDLRRANVGRPVPHPYFTNEHAVEPYVEIR